MRRRRLPPPREIPGGGWFEVRDTSKEGTIDLEPRWQTRSTGFSVKLIEGNPYSLEIEELPSEKIEFDISQETEKIGNFIEMGRKISRLRKIAIGGSIPIIGSVFWGILTLPTLIDKIIMGIVGGFFLVIWKTAYEVGKREVREKLM